MTELRTAALRALASLKGYRRELGCHQPCDAERALEAALAYREDIAQAAFERWLVEKLLTVTAAQVAHAEAVESFIKPEIKGHNVEPPPEAQTEAEKIAYCAGWWAAMEAKQNPQEKLLPWKGLTEEEHNYYKACGFVGVKAVEEKLRAKNSTLACIPAVPPG
jgi:hypothetical protein